MRILPYYILFEALLSFSLIEEEAAIFKASMARDDIATNFIEDGVTNDPKVTSDCCPISGGR